jgi:hypothetical protein
MTTKILALTDALGNLVRFDLSPAIVTIRSACRRSSRASILPR